MTMTPEPSREVAFNTPLNEGGTDGVISCCQQHDTSHGFPDPTVLTPQERESEFGRIMLRAIERRRTRRHSALYRDGH